MAGSLPPVSSSSLWPPPPICREPPLPWQKLLVAFLTFASRLLFQKIYQKKTILKQSKWLPLLVWTIPSHPVWVGAHCSTTWNMNPTLSSILHHLKQLGNNLIRRATLSSSRAGFWVSSTPFASSTPGSRLSTETVNWHWQELCKRNTWSVNLLFHVWPALGTPCKIDNVDNVGHVEHVDNIETGAGGTLSGLQHRWSRQIHAGKDWRPPFKERKVNEKADFGLKTTLNQNYEQCKMLILGWKSPLHLIPCTPGTSPILLSHPHTLISGMHTYKHPQTFFFTLNKTKDNPLTPSKLGTFLLLHCILSKLLCGRKGKTKHS